MSSWSDAFLPDDRIRFNLRPKFGVPVSISSSCCSCPRLEVWFYPQDSRKYVCGEFNRSFDGPHVQVRVPPHL
jgi:hypothetical protein